MKRKPTPAAVHSSISLSPSELPKAKFGRRMPAAAKYSRSLNELALVGVYSDLNRDPRGHIVSVAYTTRLPSDVLPRAGSDATSAEWLDTRQVTLGLDHDILADAKAKIFSHIRLEVHDAQADH